MLDHQTEPVYNSITQPQVKHEKKCPLFNIGRNDYCLIKNNESDVQFSQIKRAKRTRKILYKTCNFPDFIAFLILLKIPSNVSIKL